MNTITKVLSVVLIATMLMSCGFSGITGSKKVITEERNITEKFEAVKVSTGIKLFITQGSKKTLIIEADDNIISILKTEVVDGVLNIYFDKIVRNAKSKQVHLTIPTLNSLKATSGASAKSKGSLSGENIIVSASSGSNIDISLNYKKIDCSGSSGSDVDIAGECGDVNLNASSGAGIGAKNLNSKNADVSASSGAGITINVSEKISASASSGGNITYYGNPADKEISKSSGGSVSAK